MTPSENILDIILEKRGIIDKNVYLNPESKPFSSPYSFFDMELAVKIVKNAILSGDKILIWGDFDADGVTATSILYKTLSALGANFEYFLPDRATMGHGINLNKLLTMKSKENIKVLITVDCGISNLKEINLIKSLGVKVILTDHHEPPETLPSADCILNPLAKNALKPDLDFEKIQNLSYLSGAGVAFMFARALLNNKFKEVEDEILALSCVGTVADVVPLKGENRIIVARGLKIINNGGHYGIKRFFEKLNFKKEVKSEDIAFILAPRINAAGRLSTPFESIKLLIDKKPYVVDETIERIDSLNKIRQSLCDKIYNEALSMLKKPSSCIVLFNPDWHLGIIGIVASRLVEKFNMPVFLITRDDKNIFRSSIRGCEGFDIAKILKSLEGTFIGAGGHLFAGGFSADPNVVTIEELSKKIKEAVSTFSKEDNQPKPLYDIELQSKDITYDLIEQINKMEPFGEQNEKPSFLFNNARVISERQIGKELNHISFSVLKDEKEFSCLFWKRKMLGFKQGDEISFIFKPELNEFNGEYKMQLICSCIINDKLENNFFYPIKIFDHRQKTGILDKIEDYVKSKNGEVKAFAGTVPVKKMLENYPSIKKNMFFDFKNKEKSVLLFDYPPDEDSFQEFIKEVEPEHLHIMKNNFSKNPNDYVSLVCGMLKFVSNHKNGQLEIQALINNTGLNEACIRCILLLLENIGTIEMPDDFSVQFIKSPAKEAIQNNPLFEEFNEEFQRVISFKEFLQTSTVQEIEEFCRL